MSHDCTHGHIWLEENGQPYARHRGRSNETVAVTCKHCPLSASLPRHSEYAGKRPPGMPIDHTIPPQMKRVVDRALADAAKVK